VRKKCNKKKRERVNKGRIERERV